MTSRLLATRRFTSADQLAFAEASGDVNPMHIDPVAARRTQAGTTVVHGIHAMLWAMDTAFSSEPEVKAAGIVARFERFIATDVEVALWATSTARGLRLEVKQDETRLATVTLSAEPPKSALPPPPEAEPVAFPRVPAVLDFQEAAALAGCFKVERGEALFPTAATRFGSQTVRGLAALSTLVGMAAPGLHSIFSALELRLTESAGEDLSYRVVNAHDVFRLLDIAVEGPGFVGKVEAFVRPPPVKQPSAAHLRSLVEPARYEGVRALVVGGSRGLGEVVAKLLAGGGARVAVTYSSGRDDAEAIADEIRSAGGDCVALKLDVGDGVEGQLDGLPFAPDQLYYFASGKIFLQKNATFSPPEFAAFCRIYVDGFARVCGKLSASGNLLAFYPSSVAVEERPRAMTEYAMAKAAGEILCADLDRFNPRVRTVVRRLPRLLTDQTATVTPVETPDATGTMLEVIGAMMDAGRSV